MKPVLVRYDDLETLVKTAFNIRRKGPLTGVVPEKIVFHRGRTRTGVFTKKLTFEELFEVIEAELVWGYTNHGKKVVIRYWMSPRATFEDLLEFFAHEIGHHLGKKYANYVKEEEKAVEFATAAIVAYRTAKTVMKTKRSANK